jgi:hypothetical protein
MLAMTSSFPPQPRQVSISIAKTRLSRCAQLIGACFATCGSSASATALRPRPAGVTAARSAL